MRAWPGSWGECQITDGALWRVGMTTFDTLAGGCVHAATFRKPPAAD